MELWDIYDRDKQRTGRTMKRNDWHMQPGDFHLTVLGVIRHTNGKYLITKRVMTKAWAPGSWEVSGGAAQAGEDSLDAVKREIKEETGLDIKHPKLCGIKWWQVDKNKRYVVILFKTNEYSGNLKNSIEGETLWASLDEIPKMKLAPDFDKMLEVFTNNDFCEHESIKAKDEWISIFK